jgi:hypothetical protein
VGAGGHKDHEPSEGAVGPALPYRSAAAFRAALTDRLRTAAKHSTHQFADLRRQFAYDRLLARVFTAEPDAWVLKGGTYLLARLPEARASLDVDLYYAALDEGLDHAIAALREAAAMDLGDFFELRLGTPRPRTGVGALAVNIPVDARLGNKTFERFPVDLALGAAMTVAPEPTAPLTPVTIAGLATAVYQGYPLVDQIADKVAATLGGYRDGAVPSTRVRDLPDLTLIAIQQPVSAPALRTALVAQLTARSIAVPDSFTVPDPVAWAARYPRVIARVPALARVSFDEALDTVKALLDPVLADSPVRMWDPVKRRWN